MAIEEACEPLDHGTHLDGPFNPLAKYYLQGSYTTTTTLLLSEEMMTHCLSVKLVGESVGVVAGLYEEMHQQQSTMFDRQKESVSIGALHTVKTPGTEVQP